MPPVNVLRLLSRERQLGLPPAGSPAAGYAHSHDFLVLAYFKQGGGSLRLGGREWPVETGDAYVISPGEVVGDAGGSEGTEGWAAFFPPEVLGSGAPAPSSPGAPTLCSSLSSGAWATPAPSA